MRFPTPLVEARLIRRYKRFLADVEFADGGTATVHCANPGSMIGLADPGIRIFLSKSESKTRKLAWSWELAEIDGALVGINTAHPNRLVSEALAESLIPELANYAHMQREVRYGKNSRIDFLLSDDSRGDAYVEIKNVHLSRQRGLAEFPDSVTARGSKHLAELSDMVAAGHRAVMLYLVQRDDAERFSLARDIDPTYADSFDRAREAGVEALAYDCGLTLEEITVNRPIPMVG